MIFLALAVLLGGLGQAKASDILTVSASDCGFYDSNGNHDSSNKNYISSSPNSLGISQHNYFVFDLSGVTGTIESATLKLWDRGTTFRAGTYTSYGVANPPSISDIESSQTALTGGTGIFASLTSGTQYGSANVASGLSNTYVTINLNSDAVADLQAHVGSLFAFGGGYASPQYAYVFGQSTQADLNQLVLTTVSVPEPSTLILASTMLGVLAVGLGRWRRAK